MMMWQNATALARLGAYRISAELGDMNQAFSRCLRLGMLLIFVGCSSAPTGVGSIALLDVVPAGGAANVGIDAAIEVRFDNIVAPGATQPIALQVGECPGPVVFGVWSRTADGLGLRFEPSQSLSPSTLYTIHIGGGITGSEGEFVDLESQGLALGGTWVTRAMVMDMVGAGMGMSPIHNGPEWLYTNGMYGLAFTFSTGR